jgi:hypothetical protein
LRKKVQGLGEKIRAAMQTPVGPGNSDFGLKPRHSGMDAGIQAKDGDYQFT